MCNLRLVVKRVLQNVRSKLRCIGRRARVRALSCTRSIDMIVCVLLGLFGFRTAATALDVAIEP